MEQIKSEIHQSAEVRPAFHLPQLGQLDQLVAFDYKEDHYYIRMYCMIDQSRKLVEAVSTDLIHWKEQVIDEEILDTASPLRRVAETDYYYVTNDHGEQVWIGWLVDAHYLTLPYIVNNEGMRAITRQHGQGETAEGYAMKHLIKLHPYEGRCFELIIDVLENESTEFFIELRASKKEATRITYNQRERRITLDCIDSSIQRSTEPAVQSLVLHHDLKQLQIFVDQRSIELIVNENEAVLTAVIFPSEQATAIRTATESGQVYFKFTKYEWDLIDKN